VPTSPPTPYDAKRKEQRKESKIPPHTYISSKVSNRPAKVHKWAAFYEVQMMNALVCFPRKKMLVFGKA